MDFRYKKKYIAQNGEVGGASNRTGKDGEDLVIKVPAGTTVKDEKTGRILADLTEAGQKVIVLKGGHGGKGNQNFATPTRQAPNFAKAGVPGDEANVILELKLLADVGLIGYPSVGKSTILSMITEAKPKIADYHFTTLIPNLGVVGNEFGKSFIIADIPGLIEGAHEGVGLGHEFLRHVERTRVLVHVLDASGIEGRDPIEDFDKINNELELYSPKLKQKYQVVAANKMDIPEAKENYNRLKKELESRGYEVFPISASTRSGLSDLFSFVAGKLATLPIEEEATEEIMEYKEEKEEPFTVRVEGNTYIVEGKWIQRVVNSTNFDDLDSLNYFQRSLRNKGVIEELERMGIKEGDNVKIYDIEFEFVH
jgi:GTP-binding protein